MQADTRRDIEALLESQRADESLLDVFPGSQLDNPYSMNVADVCPVGALTTRDFRFKIRVWFLEDVASVCNQCSRGCNIWMSRAHGRVYRYLPRRNDAVNDSWICDHGRMSYQTIREGRLERPRVAGEETAYRDAVKAAGQLLGAARESGARIAGLVSPFAPNEDLQVLCELLARLGAAPARVLVPRGEADDLLVMEEKAPNAAGARALGCIESEDPVDADLAVLLGPPAPALDGVREVILIDTHDSPLAGSAAVALPARSFAERAGTFTNHAGLEQRFEAVVEPPFEAWDGGEILRQLAAAAGLELA